MARSLETRSLCLEPHFIFSYAGCHFAERHYTDCHILLFLFFVMLIVVFQLKANTCTPPSFG
jgi:hypothetical protein